MIIIGDGTTGGGQCAACGKTVTQERINAGMSAYICSKSCSDFLRDGPAPRVDIDRARAEFAITVEQHTPDTQGSPNRYGIKRNGGWWWIAYLSKERAEEQADRLAQQLIAEYWV